MNAARQATLRNGMILGLFVLCATLGVYLIFDLTRAQIAVNERQVMRDQLARVLATTRYNNDLLQQVSVLQVSEATGVSEAMPYYVAVQGEVITAFVFTVVAPDGYSGPIKLLVGITPAGEVLAVRVVAHRETPGLGDAIESKKSPWINMFNGRSLQDPAATKWKVKKDGGEFDQLSGATISPRAIVKAVHRLLVYFVAHQGELQQAFYDQVGQAQ